MATLCLFLLPHFLFGVVGHVVMVSAYGDAAIAHPFAVPHREVGCIVDGVNDGAILSEALVQHNIVGWYGLLIISRFKTL